MENIARYCLNEIQEKGAQKAFCSFLNTEKHELNVASGEISLFRTNFDTKLYLMGIKDDRKGTITINKSDKEALDEAALQVLDLIDSSQPDPANDIAEKQPSKTFSQGPEEADLDLMYKRLQEFLDYTKKKYPQTIIEEINFSFNKKNGVVLNSNGVDFQFKGGHYEFVVMFTSKDGEKTSSFNYAVNLSEDLERPFSDCSSIDRLLKQSSEQLLMHSIPEKFTGDVIFTPECLDDVLGKIMGYISDYSLIKGSSVYKDKLEKQIASSCLTVHSMPLSKKLAQRYFITGDGYEAQNSTIIEKGILKCFNLSLYGARKTGLKKAVNNGGCYVVEPGDTAFADMIKSTEKGILLCRFSGGNPSDNGDFSGVAKNSYYIENGVIKYPVNETMITGNLVEMLQNIEQISQERVNPGYHIYPWIKFKGVTVSGK
jgi:PmbA protein